MGLFTRIFNIPNYINVYKKFDDLLFHRVDFYPDAVNHQPNRHTDIFPASPQHGSTVGTLRINKLLTKKGKPGEVKKTYDRCIRWDCKRLIYLLFWREVVGFEL